MKMRGGAVDGLEDLYRRILGYKKRQTGDKAGRVKTFRGNDLIFIFSSSLRIFMILIVFLFESFFQLAFAFAVDCRIIPVHTEIAGYIVPVRIKISDYDSLAEGLRHQGKQ